MLVSAVEANFINIVAFLQQKSHSFNRKALYKQQRTAYRALLSVEPTGCKVWTQLIVV